MQFELFNDREFYYTRLPGSVGTLRWQQEGGIWKCVKRDVPSSALAARFDELPEDLQEEVLAVAMREEAVGGVDWGNRN